MSETVEPLVAYACKDRVAAMHRFDMDVDADVAVLCGNGRAFSSGADEQRQLRSREEIEKHGGPQARDANAQDLMVNSVNWKPVICAVPSTGRC